MDKRIEVDPLKLQVETCGFAQDGLYELRVRVNEERLLDDARVLLERLVAYQRNEGRLIRPDETVRHGYWTIQFQLGSDGYLVAWEYCVTPGEPEWKPGVQMTLTFWHDQRELCESLRIPFNPPHGTDWALVSAGVLDGRWPLEGIRFNCDAPDSGWVFTTDLYDGDTSSLKQVPLYEITHARPELWRVVGVSAGHFFRVTETGAGSGIWFDKETGNTPIGP